MTYPMLNNISTGVLPDLFIYANDVTYDVAGMVILITVTIIAFAGLSIGLPKEKAAAGSAFITSLLAIPLYFSGIIKDYIMWSTFILTVIILFYLYFSKD